MDLPIVDVENLGWDAMFMRDVIEEFEKRRQDLRKEAASRTAELPLRYFRQQAHYTTPASDRAMIAKAVEGGSRATARILDRFGITANDLAGRVGLSEALVGQALDDDADHFAPLVMVDGEDAAALREDVVLAGRENAIEAFTSLDWGETLRFYRPSGLGLDYAVEDIVSVIASTADRGDGGLPIDGIIWPKAEHPAELVWLGDLLSRLETKLGLPEYTVKVEFLVESGWALANLADLALSVLPRLVGIIWGIADYSADVGLRGIRNAHPVAQWARAEIVNVAGAVGVPAIDSMTLNYPVGDPALTTEENRLLILDRLVEVYEDAVQGAEMGMDGKWVGHPAQLFMVRLAYQTLMGPDMVARDLEDVRAYADSVDESVGATMIRGVMSDRATDRHLRRRLRRAVALGLLDVGEAIELGIVTKAETAP